MRRWVEITSAVLGLAWLAATGVLLFFVAGLTTVRWLLGAFVVMDGAFGLCLALLLVTNTRRPYGIDQNAPHERRAEAQKGDPFASDTADLFREAILLPDGKPYGRRKGRDDPEVVKRLADVEEPKAAPMPDWAKAMKQRQAPADELARPSMLDLAESDVHIPAVDQADLEGA